jgi:hypothetical protein
MLTSDWIRLAGVIATWLVVILAIYGERIRSWLFRPALEVTLRNPRGELVPQIRWLEALQGRGRQIQARYYHVRVSNRRRFSPAHEVRVVMTLVESPGPDQLPQAVYSATLPLKWRNQEADPRPSRTIGADDFADLLYVNEEGALYLTPMITPNKFPLHHTGATMLWVTVQALSIEADSQPLRLQIAWDGQWDLGEAEMTNHLKIK